MKESEDKTVIELKVAPKKRNTKRKHYAKPKKAINKIEEQVLDTSTYPIKVVDLVTPEPVKQSIWTKARLKLLNVLLKVFKTKN
jgi:hypothetical protein